MGMQAVAPEDLAKRLPEYRIIFNTAPAMMIPKDLGRLCPESLKIELASLPGIQGDDVVKANGLPGILAPESSGKLIAATVLRLLQEDGL